MVGFFPANSDGDDLVVWEDEERRTERTRLHTLRQQIDKHSGKPHYALSDFVAPGISPENSGTSDYLGGFVVGIHGADQWAKHLEEEEHDPYRSIMVKAIADRLAEAFAELLHHRLRVAWGIEAPGQFTRKELILENYQGIRPAPGYPAQPAHTEKPILFSRSTMRRLTPRCSTCRLPWRIWSGCSGLRAPVRRTCATSDRSTSTDPATCGCTFRHTTRPNTTGKSG